MKPVVSVDDTNFKNCVLVLLKVDFRKEKGPLKHFFSSPVIMSVAVFFSQRLLKVSPSLAAGNAWLFLDVGGVVPATWLMLLIINFIS